MNKFRKLKSLTLLLIPLLAGGAGAITTPTYSAALNPESTYSEIIANVEEENLEVQLNLLKEIFQSWDGKVNSNPPKALAKSPWNDLNLGSVGVQLTLEQAKAKILFRIEKKKDLFTEWGGDLSSDNSADGDPDTGWNQNNRIGNSNDDTYLNHEQGNAKINYQRNLKLEELKATFKSWDGVENTENTADAIANTQWNTNNKFTNNQGADIFLLLKQAIAKINYQRIQKLDQLKATFKSLGGVENTDNTADAHASTQWNTNNRIGNSQDSGFEFTDRFLTLAEANDKLDYQRLNVLFVEFSETSQDDATFDTISWSTISWTPDNNIVSLDWTITASGSFTLSFTIDNGTLKYRLINTAAGSDGADWTVFNAEHNTFSATDVPTTVAEVIALINTAHALHADTQLEDELTIINTLFTDDTDTNWVFDTANNWLTLTIDQGTFRLTFTNADGTLKYTLIETANADDADWSTLNADHQDIEATNVADTPVLVNTLINTAFNTAALKTINDKFAADGWTLASEGFLTWVVNKKGTFELTFSIDNGTIFYTLEQTAAAENTDWSTFNTTHNSAPRNANEKKATTSTKVKRLINQFYADVKRTALETELTNLKNLFHNHADWNLDNDVLTSASNTKGTFSLTFTIDDNTESIFYTLEETANADNADWSAFNSDHRDAKNADAANTVSKVNTLINTAFNTATLKAINDKFAADGWTLDNHGVLISDSTTKGTFILTFSIDTTTESIFYTLSATNIVDVDWTQFNTDHRDAKNADAANTFDEVNTLINTAFNTATLKTINDEFAADGWTLDNDGVLTSASNTKGTFSLTFTIDTTTESIFYTLEETANAVDADWTEFNSDHQVAKTADNANTIVKVNNLISIAHTIAVETATSTALVTELARINTLFTTDGSWSLDGTSGTLTSNSNDKGTFSLTFTIDAATESIFYTLSAANIDDVDWTQFNSDHRDAKNADDANTVSKVNTLINTAHPIAVATATRLSLEAELVTINAVFNDDVNTDWELTESVLTITIDGKGTFSLTFTIDTATESIFYTLAQTADVADADWTTFNSAHNTASDADAVNTVAEVNTLINTAHLIAVATATRLSLEAELVKINTLFTTDGSWSLDGTSGTLTSNSNDKGTFSLTFNIADETLKYTLIETANAEDADWSAFNTDHQVAKTADTANTIAKVNTLINTAHEIAIATATRTALETELTRINSLFTLDGVWTLDETSNFLTTTIANKGTFKLTFNIADETLKYTLIETANAEDADWSAFNSAHNTASDASFANTITKVNTLINTAHLIAVATATRLSLEAELVKINTLFTTDGSWSLDGTSGTLTSNSNDKGTFSLTFNIADETLKYTLIETANAEDADWSAFNTDHQVAKTADTANTIAKVNTLINTAHEIAIATATRTALEAELTRINSLFTLDGVWTLDETSNFLTTIITDKGTFKLTFSINNGTIFYMLKETADPEDADWSEFNTDHQVAKTADTANTVDKVNGLINSAYTEIIKEVTPGQDFSDDSTPSDDHPNDPEVVLPPVLDDDAHTKTTEKTDTKETTEKAISMGLIVLLVVSSIVVLALFGIAIFKLKKTTIK